jgi:hypothetical protein
MTIPHITNSILRIVAITADVGNFFLSVVASKAMLARVLIENNITVKTIYIVVSIFSLSFR